MPRRKPSPRKSPDAKKAPLIIAVTGHRDFGKRAKKVEKLVRAELQRIAQAHPDTPVSVVSALAEGADRLVANLAREILDASLVASLPMPADAYATDFASAASRREFRNLLKSADSVIEAPILSKGRKWRSFTEERFHQYAWGGAYVAKNADVLMTLWDGKPARGTGGTAHVVDWFMKGVTPRRYAMSRWRMRRAPSPHKPTLVHINPETLKVRRRKPAR